MTTEEKLKLVQGQLEAYNNRDIEQFCTFYHPDVVAYRLGKSEPILQGIESFRKSYGVKFENTPDLHCTLKNRTVLKNRILDEEWVVPGESHVIAIYDFQDGLIKEIYFVY